MNENRYLIGPSSQGIRGDIKPFAIPEDSYKTLENCYNYLSRITRRDCYSLLGRLSIIVSDAGPTTVASLVFGLNLFSFFSIVGTGLTILPGSLSITIVAGSTYTFAEDPNNPGYIIQTSAFPGYVDGVINYNTSDVTLNFSPAITVASSTITFSYCLNLPVMGIGTRLFPGINNQQTICFDTQESYLYSSVDKRFDLLPSTMPVTWSGLDYQQFFTTNYAGAFWATNSVPGFHGLLVAEFSNATATTVQVRTSLVNNYQVGDNVYFLSGPNALLYGTVTLIIDANNFVFTNTLVNPAQRAPVPSVETAYVMNDMRALPGQDGIRYYTGSTWVNYNPPLNTTTALTGALLIFPYRGYLMFLNTSESSNGTSEINYPQRMRWTQLGTPYYSPPAPANQTVDPKAVRDDIFGRGNFSDAPTGEQIVGAAFIRDILVVYFENSTWRIRFTSISSPAFVWERVNVEFGTNSTFSVIPFDKGLMSIGGRGFIISDGNDTVRVDEAIPIDYTKVSNLSNGPYRISGIRSFDKRLCYWSYPQANSRLNNDSSPVYKFPNRVFVYNYALQTWSYYNDSFTCFGTFIPTGNITWGDMTDLWSSYDKLLPSYSTDLNILAGNQEGFVLIMEQGTQNSTALYISGISTGPDAIFTVNNHNLVEGNWIKLSGIPEPGYIEVPSYGILQQDTATEISLNGRNFRVSEVIDSNNLKLEEFSPNEAEQIGDPNKFTYKIDVPYIPIYPTSVFIYVGTSALSFRDINGDGVLYSNGLAAGTIDYITGVFTLNFSPPATPGTPVIFRVVSYQEFKEIGTVGTYEGGGYMTVIPGMKIQSKYFNFFKQDQRARISKIDFYTLQTDYGEVTCNIYGDSNSSTPLNLPIQSVPPSVFDNARSNIVVTKPNNFQVTPGTESIYRLFCNALASTLQIELEYSDQQMAVDAINTQQFELNAMIISIRPAGRVV